MGILPGAPSVMPMMLMFVVLTVSALTNVIMGNPLTWFDFLFLIWGGVWILVLGYCVVSEWWTSRDTSEKRIPEET